MKIRNGFVSNSSSSSFVVIGHGSLEMANELINDGWQDRTRYGQTEFGWQNEQYRSVESRVNFAVLQAQSLSNPEWLEMIEKVIMEHTGAMFVVHEISDDYDAKAPNIWGYIDHQSAACEGQNIEMFNDEDTLKRFLFANDSYIQTGNDND